jgi:hypothetical protein
MKDAETFLHRVLRDESGAAAILVAVAMFALIGFGALAVDVGYLFYAQSALQTSANAAAMAGAQDIGIGSGTPYTTATYYSAVAGNANAQGNLTVTMSNTGLPSPNNTYPLLHCYNEGGACSTVQTPSMAPTGANGIMVEQQATVPLFFGRILMPSVTLSARAVALGKGGVPQPLNVMFVIDTTGSMATQDCSGNTTRIDCARNGIKTLLGELWPCASNLANCGTATNGNVANPVDEVGLMQFPGVESVPANNACTSFSPTAAYSGIKGVTKTTGTVKGNNTLNFNPTPAFNTGVQALVSEAGTPTSARTRSGNALQFQGGMTALSVGAPIQDLTNPGAIPAGTTVSSANATTVTMSSNVASTVQSGDMITFGSIAPGTYITSVTGTTAVMSAGAANGVPIGDEIHVWPPVYPLVPLSSDYRTSDTSALNANSNLVKCVNALQAAGGTYYADAITVAQNILKANARPGATNVIVMLTDGGSNADNSNAPDNMLAANIADQCKQGVLAAQNAAKAGTWVYTIAYAATTQAPGDCVHDKAPYSTCFTISQMANVPGPTPGTYVNDPTKFYSDNSAGCKSTANPNITSINQIFQSIGYSVSTARLLPGTACFGSSPASWC